MAGRITIDIFTTLDGVAQSPGAADEDTEGGFPFGGWQAPVEDDLVGEQVTAAIRNMDALVLGRKTYDIFAGYWPHHADGVIGRTFASIPKYVASRGTPSLDWQGTTRLGADAAADVAALREKHDDIHVIGSLDFVQTLLAAEAYDELVLWVFPIVLGQGKRVFAHGRPPARLRLVAPPVVGGTGALLLRYAPDGVPVTGVAMG